MRSVSDLEMFRTEMEKGMFLLSPWCGNQKCEESIKEDTGADIRVIPFDARASGAPCIVCGAPSKVDVIFARGY